MASRFNKVSVSGLGYIGLPTASLLATKGYTVHGIDVRPEVVEIINQGRLHITEPDLDILVKSAVQSGHLQASLEPTAADVFILAVPTPFKENHVPDLSYVEAATRAIAPYVAAGNLVILESTSPVGTSEQVSAWLQEQRPDLKVARRGGREGGGETVYVAHCPERVLPGAILKELVENDRIIGGVDEASTEKAAEFYRTFITGKALLTDARTAELCKLSENAYRDVNIAFANELSLICERLEIDVWSLIKLANHHPRVNILRPGPGVGGHCIAVDPWFIIHSAPQDSPLMRTARGVNNQRPHQVVEKIATKASRFKDPVIACFGLAYKPNIDDLRESPSVEVVKLLGEGRMGRILAVEPYVKSLPRELAQLDNVTLTDADTAVEQADILVLLVNHDAFLQIDPQRIREKVRIDTQGLWR